MSLSLLVIVVVVFVVVGGASRMLQLPTSRSSGAPTYPYYGRKALFSAAERSFLGVLDQVVEGRYRVFAKVRLADTLGVERGTPAGERQRALNRVVAKHVDFVLCHPQTLEIAALVELDDASHKRPDRRVRDAFLEKACAAAHVRLLRFPVRERYSLGEVRTGLAALDTLTDSNPLAASTANPSIGRPSSRG